MELKAEQDARKRQKREGGHVNWSLPENLEKLKPAVEGWLDGSAKSAGYSLRRRLH